MLIRRIKGKFAAWREEPEDVRLRIATLLTAGTGIVAAAFWLFILLPLQLHLQRPTAPTEEAGGLQAVLQDWRGGQVSGVQDIPSPSPSLSPTPDVQYYHTTRPSLQEKSSPLP